MKSQMKFVVAILAISSFLCGNVAVSEETADIDFGEALNMYLAALQRIMPCGFEPLGIPVMAPLTHEYLPYNFSTDSLKVWGNISKLAINGLNNWQMLGNSFDKTENRYTYDIIFPEIHILAEKSLQSWGFVANFPASFKADFVVDVKLIGLRYIGEYVFGENSKNPNGLEIKSNKFDFYVADIAWKNWNKSWDIDGNNFFNKWAREFLLMTAHHVQGNIDGLFNMLALPIVNSLLENVSMDKLIQGLVYSAQQMNAATC